ncbi:MAG: hypothetical protein WC819_05290 [Parcubacteria group bacterium]|jgi:hypothetical protein
MERIDLIYMEEEVHVVFSRNGKYEITCMGDCCGRRELFFEAVNRLLKGEERKLLIIWAAYVHEDLVKKLFLKFNVIKSGQFHTCRIGEKGTCYACNIELEKRIEASSTEDIRNTLFKIKSLGLY